MTKRPAYRDDETSLISNERIELIPLKRLRLFESRVRIPDPGKTDRVASSISFYGFLIPLLIDENNRVVDGEVRVAAARILGLRTVPCIRVTHLSDAQVRAFRIASNRHAEDSNWDPLAVKAQIELILRSEPGFDCDLFGFQVPQMDLILNPEPKGAGGDRADEDGIVPERIAVSRVGDEWHLGDHTLLCGDATKPETVTRLLGGVKAPLYAGDPPYGVSTRKIGGRGRIKHKEFIQGSGEQTDEEYAVFLLNSISAAKASLKPGALVYLWIDHRRMEALLKAGRDCGLSLVNICVWCKSSPGMGSFYRSQTEYCVVFGVPGAARTNNIRLGKFGRNRSNVWFAPGMNVSSRERMELLRAHPTVKACQLIEGILKDASRRKEIVVDTFCGSGTTLIAAQKTGRIARCLELDPLYIDVACRRFEKRFGIAAVHAVTGRSFADEAAYRLSVKEDAAPRPVRRPPAVASKAKVGGRGRG